jgi:hypothetical protein
VVIVKKDMKELKTDWNEDMNHAYNREEWKNLVLTVKGLNGL